MKRKLLAGCRLILNVAGVRRGRKVFAVGFNKCATTSLHDLFLRLGLPSYHGTRWRSCDHRLLFRAFDCFSDGIPSDLPRLDRWFPGSKFILQVRDLESWVYSRLAHIDRSKRQGYYRAAPNWDSTADAVKAWIRQRNQHHLYVLEYFADRRDDLLLVNFVRDPAAGTRVDRFLGYRGQFERPQSNVNPEGRIPDSHRRLLTGCAAALGIAADELENDVFCPSLAPPEMSKYPVDTRTLHGS